MAEPPLLVSAAMTEKYSKRMTPQSQAFAIPARVGCRR